MPNPPPKKERFARFISGIRSDHRGSLVVQTGFPTSLADLVVKNRARLKKPSKKKKPSLTSDLDSATGGAPSPSDGARIFDSGDDPPTPVVANPNEIDEEFASSAPIPVLRGRRGFDFRFLIVKLVILAVLAIGKKQLVVGMTITAVGLLMLEFFGLLKPRSDSRNELGSVIQKLDLRGRVVSPIREVEIADDRRGSTDSRSEKSECLDSRSEKSECLDSRSEKSECLDSRRDILVEKKDLSVIENVLKNSKKRKLFRKLFRRKFRGEKDVKEPILASDGKEVVDSDRKEEKEEEILIEEEVENNNGDFFSFQEASDEVSEFRKEDMAVGVANSSETRQWSCRKFVFLVLVLLGLLEGRVVALVLSVIWYLLSGCAETAWRKWTKRE